MHIALLSLLNQPHRPRIHRPYYSKGGPTEMSKVRAPVTGDDVMLGGGEPELLEVQT